MTSIESEAPKDEWGNYYYDSQLSAKEIIENIEMRCFYNFGKITCSVFSSKCYLSNKTYPSSEFIREYHVKGTFSYYPYNRIQFHLENEWILKCFEQLNYVRNKIIPHYGNHHNLPSILKIPRSSGKVFDGVTTHSDYGIKIRKSKTLNDAHERFYVTVFMIEDKPVLDTELIQSENFENTRNMITKDIPLETLVEFNPILKNGVCFQFEPIKIEEDMNKIQKKVIDYCNKELEKWMNEFLIPCSLKIKDTVKIEINLI